MRSYHNYEKKSLIQRTVERLGDRPIRVLDLGSGRGGDLWKWLALKPQLWLGVDIDADSIKEAQRRIQDRATPPRESNIKFIQADLRQEKAIDTMLPRHEGLFTIVSCMFALHYFFEHPSHFDNLMATVNRYIQPGALFCATLFDGDEVKAGDYLDAYGNGMTLTTTAATEYANDDDSDDRSSEDLDYISHDLRKPPWGQHLWVQNHGGTVVLAEPTLEFRVFVHHLVSEMNENGFRLVSSDLFHPPHHFPKPIRKISGMNRWYLFEKI